jgi:ferredoxin
MNNTRKPLVDLSDCILCGVCVDVAPLVFRMNPSGYIEIVDSASYPETQIQEAIRNCPARCIGWEK